MNFKPIITYSGAGPLFRSLESHILSAIPLDTIYHRILKQVHLEATAQPLNVEALERYQRGEWSIIDHPVLHIFVTECNDLDSYKSSTRDEIKSWLKQLISFEITDWMILLVETFDVRKAKNLLSRTTVLNKIRLDFCSKNDDRCISVLNPAKFEQKSTESFRCLVQRIRFLMVSSYYRNIAKYEELIRANFQKRNQSGWDFRKYFILQEDLALVFEKLCLYSEALQQYDELEEKFSEFILHSEFGEKLKQLDLFKQPLTSFHGVCLTRRNKFEVREKIHSSSVSLLEFRNYIFERQAHLLQISNKTPEIAERLLNFLFTTLREIDMIKVDYQDGALQCWEFACALEVLQICDQAIEPDEVTCFQYCAPIWNLAKDKLYELGKLCGLLPGCTPTSEQLHIVVNLSAGIGDTPVEEQFLDPSPQVDKTHSPNRKPKECPKDQLKKALSSNHAFQKLYLELSELAISTYKHVSRLRSARLAGLDLGNFYCALNEPHKSVVFFTDLLRELKAESWNYLASQTLLQLASCYKRMDDKLAYTKTCGAISCSHEMEMLVRTFFFDEFLKSLRTLSTNLTVLSMVDTANFCVLEDYFRICEIVVLNTKPIIQDDMLHTQVKIESLFPREVFAENISLSFELNTAEDDCQSEVYPLNTQQRIKVSLHLSCKQDNIVDCASVACEKVKKSQPVRRSSSTKRKLSPTVQSDFKNFVVAERVALHPGINTIEMKNKATRVGVWSFKQMSIQINLLQFLSERIPFSAVPFDVTTKPASALLSFKNLIAGIEQPVSLIVSSGSFIFPSDAKINLRCSQHMQARILTPGKESEFESNFVVPLEHFKSFEEREIHLEVITKLPGGNLTKPVEHNISLGCPWLRNELNIPLDFMPLITAVHRLHTCGTQKFLQIILKGVSVELIISKVRMQCKESGIHLIDLNPTTQMENRIYKGSTVAYIWGVQLDWNVDIGADIRLDFKAKYARAELPGVMRSYTYSFELSDYNTLFKIQAQLVPNELCRLRSVCNMNLKITKLRNNKYSDLMYEVLTDNIWTVCGQSAGVFSMKNIDSHSISLDVMPLSTGFLPMPSIRLSQFKTNHSKVVPFAAGQVYNSTKSVQIHVMASNSGDQ